MICFDDYFKFEKMNTLANTDVMVSIWCNTYNHIDYIEKCLQGLLSQITTFNYEIIIFDDASTDGTQDIIRRYAEDNPSKIKAFLAQKNTYKDPEKRLIRSLFRNSVMRGKYTALCEGDDFWIYPYKLQRQVDIMEADDTITLCYHNAIRFNENEIIPQILDMDTQVVNCEEVFFCKNGRPPTASFLYRTSYAQELVNINSYLACPVGDDPLRFYLNAKGKILYLDKCWCVRNYMHEGSWNKTMTDNNDYAQKYRTRFYKYYELFDEETKGVFHSQIEEMKYNLCKLELNELFKTNSCKEIMKKINDCIEMFGSSAKRFFLELALLEAGRCRDYYDVIKELSDQRKVYIYGAGEEAKRVANILLGMKINISGFLVSQKESNPDILMGIPVDVVFDKQLNSQNSLIVLGLNDYNKKQVINAITDLDLTLI